jgi:hypothetical protein
MYYVSAFTTHRRTVMNKLSDKAVEILREVQKKITEEPRRLSMGDWGFALPKSTAAANIHLPPCGTVACIAGHVVLSTPIGRTWLTECGISVNEKGEVLTFDRHFPGGAQEVAAWILGLTDHQSSELFYNDYWPDDFMVRYAEAVRAGDQKLVAKVACERIDHLIETGI